MRIEMSRLMRLCADALADAVKDSRRLDWLLDKDNHVGNVQLPRECVERNIHDMRAAIDDAMQQASE